MPINQTHQSTVLGAGILLLSLFLFTLTAVAQVQPGSRMQMERVQGDEKSNTPAEKPDTLKTEEELYGSFEANYREALRAIETQQFPRARTLLNECLRFNPRHESSLLLSAELHSRAGEPQKALEDFTTLLRLDPSNVDALKQRALLYALLGRHERALEDLDAALKRKPDDALLHYNRALTLQALADDPFSELSIKPKDILEVLDKTLELDPDLLEAYVRRGQHHALHNKPEEALKDFTLVLEHEPNRADVLTMRGQTYSIMEKHEKARADYKRSQNLEPTDKTHRLLAATYFRLGDLDAALEQYDLALDANPGDPALLLQRASVFAMQDNPLDAIDEYSKVLEQNPLNGEALMYRGMMRTLVHDFEQACPDLRKAMQLGQEQARRYLEFYCN